MAGLVSPGVICRCVFTSHNLSQETQPPIPALCILLPNSHITLVITNHLAQGVAAGCGGHCLAAVAGCGKDCPLVVSSDGRFEVLVRYCRTPSGQW